MGFLNLKDIYRGLPVLCSDGFYHKTEDISYGRAERILSILIDGIPQPLMLTSEHTLPVLRNDIETLAAAEIKIGDRLVCPKSGPVEEGFYGDLMEAVLDNIKILGAFCLAGRISDNFIAFNEDAISASFIQDLSCMVDGVARVRESRGNAYVVSDENIFNMIIELFGITGGGSIPPVLFELDKQAKFMFIGGALSACGVLHENCVSCPVYGRSLEFLEFVWSSGLPAAEYRAKPPISYSNRLIIPYCAEIQETTSGLRRDNAKIRFPDLKMDENNIYPEIKSITMLSWGQNPVYSLEIPGISEYNGNLVAVAGDASWSC